MKTIKILKALINILYVLLLIALGIATLFLIMLLFFDDSLPTILQGYKMIFSSFFSWKTYLIPMTTAINFVLFIISISFLRKCVSLFMESDFYSDDVIKSLKKAGNLFVFIGVSTIIAQLFSVLYIQNLAQNIIQIKASFFYKFLNTVIAVIDLKSIFSIVIGLFLLLFSKIFENSRTLKLENDLTI